MSFDFEKILNEGVACQKRTARYKKFVVMSGNYIYKGPYIKSQLDAIFYRSRKLIEWNAKFIVHPADMIYDDINVNSYFYGSYIIFDNLAKNYPISFNPWKESFSNISYNVLKRVNLVKLGDVILKVNYIRNLIPYISLSMIYLYILGVGDVGLSNILIDQLTGNIYIIDYEENVTSLRTSELFYFSKDPSKAKTKLWLEYVRPYYSWLIDELSINSNDNNYKSKFIHAISLIRKYSEISPETIQTKNIQYPDQNTIQISSNIGTSNIGFMRYTNQYVCSTYSGYTSDIVKSALQKYIRRSIIDKAIISGFELYRMAELSMCQRFQTNLYNRLAVIAAEDISIANFSLVIAIHNIILSKNRDIEVLATIIYKLAVSEKIRIGSHAYRAYIHPDGRKYAESLGVIVSDVTTEEDINRFGLCDKFWKTGDPEDIKYYANMFYLRILDRNWLCLYWLGLYMNASTGKKIVKRNRRTDPMIIIFKMLETVINQYAINTIENIYQIQTEKRPFIMLAVIASLMRVDYENVDLQSTIMKFSQDKELMNNLMTGNYTFQVDDYVIDMHTKKGKSNGKTRYDFVTEGSFVTPRSEKYHYDILEKIYIES